MSIAEQTKAIFDKHIPVLKESTAKKFRKAVLDELQAETGCSLSAAAGRYNAAKKAALQAGELSNSDFGFVRSATRNTDAHRAAQRPQRPVNEGRVEPDLTKSDDPKDYLPWSVVDKKNAILHTRPTKAEAEKLCEEGQRVVFTIDALGLEEK